VCSSHGKCISQDQCLCDATFEVIDRVSCIAVLQTNGNLEMVIAISVGVPIVAVLALLLLICCLIFVNTFVLRAHRVDDFIDLVLERFDCFRRAQIRRKHKHTHLKKEESSDYMFAPQRLSFRSYSHFIVFLNVQMSSKRKKPRLWDWRRTEIQEESPHGPGYTRAERLLRSEQD